MKKYNLIFFFFIFITKFSFSQIPDGYYDSAEGLSGVELQEALKNRIDWHSVKNYDDLWDYFEQTDLKSTGRIWDIYSDGASYSFIFQSSQCGSYSSEGDCYNREHAWPQSWFSESSPMKSDLFHIYPTDGKVNGIRSDYPYGEVGSASITTQNGSKLGTCNYPGYSGTVFEPIDEFKGDLARTYFYMSTRYYGEDSWWQTNDMVDKSQLKPWALNMMKEWNRDDPVSQKEIDRNNAIYLIQYNRNPFIDHPEYVTKIWGWPEAIEDVVQAGFTIYPNPVKDVLNINMDKISKQLNINIFNIVGQEVFSKKYSNIQNNIKLNIDNLTEGIYFLEIKSDDKPSVYQKIILKK